MIKPNIPPQVAAQLDQDLSGVYTDIQQIPDTAHPGIAQAKRDDFGFAERYKGGAIVYSKYNGNWKPVTDITGTLDPAQFLIIRSASDIPLDLEERDAMIAALAEFGGDADSRPASVQDIEHTVRAISDQRGANQLREKYNRELHSEVERARRLTEQAKSIGAGLAALED